MFVVVTICDVLSFGYKDSQGFADIESAAAYAAPFVLCGSFAARFQFYGG